MKFDTSDSEELLPGSIIQIKAGTRRENQELFKGIITGQSITIKEKGISKLVIECSDEAVRMTAGRHSRYFQHLKDSIGLYWSARHHHQRISDGID